MHLGNACQLTVLQAMCAQLLSVQVSSEEHN
jgi:hypothetical protein